MDWVVNESVDWLNQEGLYVPPVTFVLLLLDPDKLAKVATGFSAQPLDQHRGRFQPDNVWLMNL
jgi:hypothetical protein